MISEAEEGSILLKLIFEKSHNKGSSEVNTQTKDFLILKPMLFLFVCFSHHIMEFLVSRRVYFMVISHWTLNSSNHNSYPRNTGHLKDQGKLTNCDSLIKYLHKIFILIPNILTP